MTNSTFCALALMTTLCLTSCDGKKSGWTPGNDGHEFGKRYVTAQTLDELMAYVDSLDESGTVGAAEIELLRAYTYQRHAYETHAADDHYVKSYELYTQESDPKVHLYAEAAFRCANVYSTRGDKEKAVSILTNTLLKYEDDERLPDRWKSTLLNILALYQGEMGLIEDSKQTFDKAYQLKLPVVQEKKEPANDLFLLCLMAIETFNAKDEIEAVDVWRERAETVLNDFAQDFDSLQSEQNREYLAFRHMFYLIHIGKEDEAKKLYESTPHDAVLNYYAYKELVPDYLFRVKRYAEAADIFERIDAQFGESNEERGASLEVFGKYYEPRYLVNRMAGRSERALVFADSVFNNLDSALVRLRREKAVELATIYQTHEKELALKDAQAETRFHRFLLLVIIVFFLFFLYHFVRIYLNNKELLAKNRYLFEQNQQREQVEQEQLQTLQSQPEDTLTSDQQLYRRLCALMVDKQPYTDEDLNRETLAKMLGTNSHYIVEAIRQCSHGETVADFITRYRLEHAARLLKTTDTPVNLVGEMSGIPSRASLARLFRNTYGMS